MPQPPPTIDEINQAADVFARLLDPHVLIGIEAHRDDALSRVPWPFGKVVAKHWPCFVAIVPGVVQTAMRSALAQLRDVES